MNGERGTPSITLEEYQLLPPPIRKRVDAWLEAENLKGEMLVGFRLLEGAIEAERYVRGADGRLAVNEHGDVSTEIHVYPITTAPPSEALA